jgi:16S rRNA (cytosine1402-N4)-methyltransferase
LKYAHIPVLLKEVVHYLSPKAGETFVDATLGGGGYCLALLDAVGSSGRVLAIDADRQAVDNFKFKILNLKLANADAFCGNFRNIDEIARISELSKPDGVVADLGFSTGELEESGRGLSFQKDEPLDMRFDLSSQKTAADVVNFYSEKELARIFESFGEDKHAKLLAKKLVMFRSAEPINTTGQLTLAIKKALPSASEYGLGDVYRRIFQALRIEVNQELQALEEFLPKAFDLLAPSGKLAVVSFHSLEDRIVKRYFSSLIKGCVCPPSFPVCVCGKNPEAKLITRKAVIPSKEEQLENPKSKSAKLRVIMKLENS